jgi:hypothetical protein
MEREKKMQNINRESLGLRCCLYQKDRQSSINVYEKIIDSIYDNRIEKN